MTILFLFRTNFRRSVYSEFIKISPRTNDWEHHLYYDIIAYLNHVLYHFKWHQVLCFRFINLVKRWCRYSNWKPGACSGEWRIISVTVALIRNAMTSESDQDQEWRILNGPEYPPAWISCITRVTGPTRLNFACWLW